VNADSLDIALRNIAETRSLLENLITSSESFDYPKAKIALKALQKKTRDLARLQTELQESKKAAASNVHAVDFRISA
jgi:hypothetical protein